MEQNGWFRLEGNRQPNKDSQQTPTARPYMEEMFRMRTSMVPPRKTSGKDCTDGPRPDLLTPPMPQRTMQAPQQAGRGPTHNEREAIHSQTVGERGPVLLQDGVLHETLETFVHTKTLERAVHVKGYGAFGSFQPYQCMKEYTTLSFLQNPSQKTQTMSRFSLAVSTKGTPDTSRNVRGFSTKFYTDRGNFDLLCNHIPVFLVEDAIRFPEAINALLPSPVNNLIDPARFWNFAAHSPESIHFITWLYSDVGTVKSLRHLRAYGVNTYVWKNAAGVRRYVKYHWIPLAGAEFIDAAEAVSLAGTNPDIAGRDLYDAIARGEPVEFELRVQLMEPQDEEALPYDPLDDTKVWDEETYPLMPVGRLTLNRNPEDYAAQIEKVAFSPSNLLEGAELSDDKMLQGRSFIYWDAQRRRLGPDFRSIPVNREQNWVPGDVVTSGNGRHIEGTIQRSAIPKQDDFTQAGEHYRSLPETEQEHLVENIAADLAFAPADTQATVLGYFKKADETFAERVSERLRKQPR